MGSKKNVRGLSKKNGSHENVSRRNLLIFRVHLTGEILNLWNDFRKVVDFLNEMPRIRKVLTTF